MFYTTGRAEYFISVSSIKQHEWRVISVVHLQMFSYLNEMFLQSLRKLCEESNNHASTRGLCRGAVVRGVRGVKCLH